MTRLLITPGADSWAPHRIQVSLEPRVTTDHDVMSHLTSHHQVTNYLGKKYDIIIGSFGLKYVSVRYIKYCKA